MLFLALSGSLRAASTHMAALEAMRLLAPAGVEVRLYGEMECLPPFNPDLDVAGLEPPVPAAALRALVGECDGLLIACPEYAHGIPGAFKNLLDWLVGSLEFPGKPVALINTSPRSVHAPAALREVLTTMSAQLIPEAFAALPLRGKVIKAADIVADPELSKPLTLSLESFALAISGQVRLEVPRSRSGSI